MKIQFLDVEVKPDDWTPGRWAVPVEKLWIETIDGNFDTLCFPIQRYDYKRKFSNVKRCKCCQREFHPNSNKQTMCGFCFDIKTCNGCGKVFITQHSNVEVEISFCSHSCSIKFASSKMLDWYKKNPEKRTENAVKMHEKGSGMKFCKTCGEETSHLVGAGCVTCHNKTESKRLSSKEHMIKLWELDEIKALAFNKSFCKKCNHITTHKFFTCLKCNPKANGAGGLLSLKESEHLKCPHHPDNRLEFHDKLANEYVCWECHKEKFVRYIKSINFANELKLDYKGCFVQSTFRTQESCDWTGAKSALEQDLADKGIGWFVYVKFYLDGNHLIKPLVVGKSGSTLVNHSGSDVSFSEHCEHGPARRFLNDFNLAWDKTRIAVIPCENETTAFYIEKEIQQRYNLFGS